MRMINNNSNQSIDLLINPYKPSKNQKPEFSKASKVVQQVLTDSSIETNYQLNLNQSQKSISQAQAGFSTKLIEPNVTQINESEAEESDCFINEVEEDIPLNEEETSSSKEIKKDDKYSLICKEALIPSKNKKIKQDKVDISKDIIITTIEHKIDIPIKQLQNELSKYRKKLEKRLVIKEKIDDITVFERIDATNHQSIQAIQSQFNQTKTSEVDELTWQSFEQQLAVVGKDGKIGVSEEDIKKLGKKAIIYNDLSNDLKAKDLKKIDFSDPSLRITFYEVRTITSEEVVKNKKLLKNFFTHSKQLYILDHPLNQVTDFQTDKKSELSSQNILLENPKYPSNKKLSKKKSTLEDNQKELKKRNQIQDSILNSQRLHQQDRHSREVKKLKQEIRSIDMRKIYESRNDKYWLRFLDHNVKDLNALRIKLEELKIEWDQLAISDEDIQAVIEFIKQTATPVSSQTVRSIIEAIEPNRLAELSLLQKIQSLINVRIRYDEVI